TADSSGRSRRSTPIENHVDRSPRDVRRRVAGTDVGPDVVCTVTVRTRPDVAGPAVACAPRGRTASFDWIVRAPSTTGPQLWYGEALSHGSGRETRYGTEK